MTGSRGEETDSVVDLEGVAMRCSPTYCRHKASGQAYVRLDGRTNYLGKYGSPESKRRYDELMSEWHLKRGNQASVTPRPSSRARYTVGMLVEAYLNFAEGYYRDEEGHTSELCGIISSVKPWLRLFGMLPVREFGPKKLAIVREEFVTRGICRGQCNQRTSTIRRIIKWGVAEELVDGEVLQALVALPGLRRGRTPARESAPVPPVDSAMVDSTVLHLPSQLADMVRLQQFTGMRPKEVCRLRFVEIQRESTPWAYIPAHHKTQRFGITRTIFFGPRAREILRRYENFDPAKYVFSPIEVVKSRNRAKHAKRVTPLAYGNSPGTHVVPQPQKAPGNRWNTAAYARAIERACRHAFPLPDHLAPKIIVPPHGRKKKPRLETPSEWRARLTPEEITQVMAWRRMHHWTPNQLRHTCATKIRDQYGLDAAQVVLGHTHANTTEIYAQANIQKAASIMELEG